MMKCADYDYIEIACMFNLEVELAYPNKRVRGFAKDIKRNDDKQEGIILQDNQKKLTWFPLANICSMTALQTNPHFDQVHFSQ